MPDPNETFSTLEDFLLSLAEGISQAQDELSRAGAAAPLGRQFAYHLPRLEFELKINLQVVEDATLSNRYSRLRTAKPTNKHLLFRSVAAEEASSTLEIAGVIPRTGSEKPSVRTERHGSNPRGMTLESSDLRCRSYVPNLNAFVDRTGSEKPLVQAERHGSNPRGMTLGTSTHGASCFDWAAWI